MHFLVSTMTKLNKISRVINVHVITCELFTFIAGADIFFKLLLCFRSAIMSMATKRYCVLVFLDSKVNVKPSGND